MSARRPTTWVKRVVVGWALFLGGFGAWGWATGSAGPSAIVSVFAAAMMLNASHQLREAQEHARRTSMGIWTAALILFAGWSGYSAHHAASLARADLGTMESFWLLAFFTLSSLIDPALMWAVNDTERGSATAPAPSAPRLATENGHAVTDAVAMASTVAAVASAVASGATTPAEAATAPSPAPANVGAERPAAVSTVNFPSARAHVEALHAGGMNPTAISRETGVPVTTVRRWTAARLRSPLSDQQNRES